jgi:putative FmdB family regulatory protein
MPIFEYACLGCGRQFEAFVTADRTPACPACEGADLQKRLSTPGMVGAAGRKDADAFSGCRSQGGQCGCAPNPSLN